MPENQSGNAQTPADTGQHKVVDNTGPNPGLRVEVSHRLATVSASQALQELRAENREHVKTGLPSLDSLLAAGASGQHTFPAGKTIEVWGAPGSGKTALALQVARKTIDAGRGVFWMDAMASVSRKRLREALFPEESMTDDRWNRFHHVQLNSLSQFLSLILHPAPDTPPPNTSLIIVDGLHGLLDIDYPRFQTNQGLSGDQYKWRVGRRQAILGSIISGLNRLAALKNVAVLVTTGCASRMRPDHSHGASLVPGVGGPEWDAGVWHRLCMFRDHHTRCLGVQKCAGRSCISRIESSETGPLLPFQIQADGSLVEAQGLVRPVEMDASAKSTKPIKRSYSEVADSEEELDAEYDWLEAEESLLIAASTKNVFEQESNPDDNAGS